MKEPMVTAHSDPLNVQEGLLPTDRLELYHLRVYRPGAPKVLLLGGSNFDLRLKRSFLSTSIAQHCDIATFEPRGIGRSAQPAGAWTMQDYAKDALAFMDAIGWSEATILGESFGGMTALHMAILSPHRAPALILASATAGGKQHASYDITSFLDLSREDAARQAMCLQDARMATLLENDPDAFAARLAQRLAFETAFADPSITSGGYARLLAARAKHDCTHSIELIKSPVTVIAGHHDLQAPTESQRALADALPKAAYHELDAGHGLLFTDPAAADIALKAIQDNTRVSDSGTRERLARSFPQS